MGNLPNLANVEYLHRINRAVDFVTRNLDRPLRLESVARAAAFSPYHFHRIFRGLMGETLAGFIKRVRLERAVYLLTHRKGARLTDVALACGFSSSSDFSRAFRAHYGVAPRRFNVDEHRQPRRQAMLQTVTTAATSHHLQKLPPRTNPDRFTVRLRDLPARRVAYVRVRNGYAGGVPAAAAMLVAWARERGLEGGQWLGYQWDDPEIVPREKCRYDVGVEVPPGTRGGGAVGVVDFAPMRVAQVDIHGSIELELRALHWLYLQWLPRSGFAPAHQPMFEAWEGLPFAHGVEHFELGIQLAVEDARVAP